MLDDLRNKHGLINVNFKLGYYLPKFNNGFIEYSNIVKLFYSGKDEGTNSIINFFDKISIYKKITSLISDKRQKYKMIKYHDSLDMNYNNLLIQNISYLEGLLDDVIFIYGECIGEKIILDNKFYKNNSYKHRGLKGKVEFIIKNLGLVDSYYIITDLIEGRNLIIHNKGVIEDTSKFLNKINLGFSEKGDIYLSKNNAEVMTDLFVNFCKSIDYSLTKMIYRTEKEKSILRSLKLDKQILDYVHLEKYITIEKLYKKFGKDNLKDFLSKIRNYYGYGLFIFRNDYFLYSNKNLDRCGIELSSVGKIYLDL